MSKAWAMMLSLMVTDADREDWAQIYDIWYSQVALVE